MFSIIGHQYMSETIDARRPCVLSTSCNHDKKCACNYSHDFPTHIWVPSIAFALWGFSDAMINTFLYWLIGHTCPDGNEKTRALGVFKLLATRLPGSGLRELRLWFNLS